MAQPSAPVGSAGIDRRVDGTDRGGAGHTLCDLGLLASQSANLLFAFELDRRAGRAGTELTSVAAHPGYAATHLQQAGPELEGDRLEAMAMGLLNRVVAQSDADGALPQLYAATMPEVAGGEHWGPDGPGEVRGAPRRVGASKQATDEGDAARLWAVSEELTGVRFAWPEG